MGITRALIGSTLLLAASVSGTLMTDEQSLSQQRNREQSLAAIGSSSDNNVLPPSSDPFYTAPAGYETAQPGAILRMRAAPGNLTSVTGNCSAAYNILYRTTNSRYNASWAVTTLFIPENPSSNSTSNGANQLLSYQIPYDSAFLDASPSYSLYAGPEADIGLSLGQGWYVNVPDYEGPLASFTAGVQSGHATIDSVRAVLNAGMGLASNPPPAIAMWGYSGGALASEWAAELAVQYAPDLHFAGAALGGLTPNVTSVLEATNGGFTSGLIPAGTLGILSQYPEVYDFFVSQLKTTGEYNATTFLNAANQTLVGTITTFANDDITQYFVNGLRTLEDPRFQRVINMDGIMGFHGVPQMPVFAYKAIQDEVSPVADTDKLINRYCSVGANIWYQRNTAGGHQAEATNGESRAFQFLTSVLGGFYDRTGCTIEDVTVAITNSTL